MILTGKHVRVSLSLYVTVDKVIRQIHPLNVLFPRLRSTLKDHMPIRLSAHGSQSMKNLTDFLDMNLEGKAHSVPINV